MKSLSLCFVLSLLVSIEGVGQNQTNDVALNINKIPFHSIKIHGDGNYIIQYHPIAAITMDARVRNFVELNHQDGTLAIRLKDNIPQPLLKHKAILLELPDLQKLEIIGDGDVRLQECLGKSSLTMHKFGNGDLIGKVIAEVLLVGINGEGIHDLSIHAKEARLVQKGVSEVTMKTEGGYTIIEKYGTGRLQLNSKVEKVQVIVQDEGTIDLDLEAKEAGLRLANEANLSGKMKAMELTLNKSKEGDVQLSGEVEQMNLQVSGEGHVNLEGLKVNHCLLHKKGSGNLKMYILQTLSMEIKGKGSVHYLGNPQVSKLLVHQE
ncbi:GIN domain-containing protein [Algivirga pacifica]